MKIINSNLKFKSLANGNVPKSIVLHHAASSGCTIEDIHRWHLNKGWAGCGYHYFVNKKGEIYKGRQDYVFGAHCLHHNTNTLGICAEGNYEVETMPKVQEEALNELVNYLIERYKNISKVYGHKELKKTACPGKKYPMEAIIAAKLDDYLRLGARGDRVKELQLQLSELGFYTGKIDGSFGPLTDAAVREFQTKHEIKIDGVVGPNTIETLAKALKAETEAEDQKRFHISKELQELLTKYNFNCGPIDGDPGDKTLNGINELVDYLY